MAESAARVEEPDEVYSADPLVGCLLSLARLHGLPASEFAVTVGLPLEDGRLLPSQFDRAARRVGLRARLLERRPPVSWWLRCRPQAGIAYNLNEARDVRDRSVRQLEETIRLAWAAYQATGAQLPLLERQVAAALATRDAYEKHFNIGQRTLLDLLNSENEVFQARQSVVEARADHLLAQYRLLEAMGALVDQLGVGEALAYSEAATATSPRGSQ